MYLKWGWDTSHKLGMVVVFAAKERSEPDLRIQEGERRKGDGTGSPWS